MIMLGQHCIGISSSQCCLNTSETTSHDKITCEMLAQNVQSSFWEEDNLYNVVLICLGQHCIRKLTVQCWPAVHKQLCTEKQSTMFSGSVCANIAQGNYLCNVKITDNFYLEHDLCNVGSIMLRQHWIRISSSQCCPNTSETRLH